MDPDLNFLELQRDLAGSMRESIISLQNNYLEQIRLTTQWLLDQKLEGIRQSTGQDCSDLDQALVEEFNVILSGISLLELTDQLNDVINSIEPADHEVECAIFWRSIIDFIEEHQQFLRQLLNSTDVISVLPPDRLSLRYVDIEHVYRRIIDPLSNTKRLDILQAIQDGKTRFKELEEALELRAGHLLYHLNPLKETQFVTQDKKKNYFLTTKGETMLHALVALYVSYDK